MNGRETMGQLAQRVRASLLQVPPGVAGDPGGAVPAPPAHRRGGEEAAAEPAQRDLRPEKPRPAWPRPCPRSRGRER